ncbi:hypothetical protein VTK73DRAFT_4163 [Phialemonium thermophilum]|uniref:HMG box domain-containing protein n=1 Tax=Phialemonium thermophilum TaxID=223376 RepID=A0ABR3XZF0_9PEZI
MAPTNAIPPALPPSVEEAYRRKCIQLKQRTNEVEEANDAARLRLNRLKRQVEKMRLERAFLLEQLARRTSTNVEDSEGSPSPPPTPKEKPLRIKRGHRKQSLLPNADATPSASGATFISQNPQTLSPSSDAVSHSHVDLDQSKSRSQARKEQKGNERAPTPTPGPSGAGADAEAADENAETNGVARKPAKSAFDFFCNEERPTLVKKRGETKNGDDGDDDMDVDVDDELRRLWKELPAERKEDFESQWEREVARYEKENKKETSAKTDSQRAGSEGPRGASKDADIREEEGGEPEDVSKRKRASSSIKASAEPTKKKRDVDDLSPSQDEDLEMAHSNSEDDVSVA